MKRSNFGFLGMAAFLGAFSIGLGSSVASDLNKGTMHTTVYQGAGKHTPIGTAIPKYRRSLHGAMPQSHKPRHTNKLHSRAKAKFKAKRK